MGLELLAGCRQLFYFGDITEGMAKEIARGSYAGNPRGTCPRRCVYVQPDENGGIGMTKYRPLWRKILLCMAACLVLVSLFALTAFAAETAGTGNVAGAIENTWNSAKMQIKSVVNNVVFPVIDLVLAVLFFAKIATAYMDYRKHGQFEFTAPAILFACLVFALTCPLYIWSIIGM